jgi:hypothetical protein
MGWPVVRSAHPISKAAISARFEDVIRRRFWCPLERDGGSADIDWKNFLKWQESKTQFLLYTSPVAFNMIPKRVLTHEQISEVRLALSQNIPVRTS